MDTSMIEENLEKRLKRILGKGFLITTGPFTLTKYSGIKPEVSINISSVEDFDGVMPDGTHISGRSAIGPNTYKGFEEERPGRITLDITVIAQSHKFVQNVVNVTTPEILLSLKLLPRIPLGSLTDESVQLHFEDYTSNFHSAIYKSANIEGTPYYSCELQFHITGFFHVWLTKKGGFNSKSTSKSRAKIVISTSKKRTKK